MSTIGRKFDGILNGGKTVLLASCLFGAAAFAADPEDTEDTVVFERFDVASNTPGSLIQGDRYVGLAFDTGDSVTPKLQLQLSEPITLEAGSGASWLNSYGRSVTASAGLDWSLDDNLRLGLSLDQQTTQFQSLGSIHCQNGILGEGSFRASNCTFTNFPEQSHLSSIDLGAEYKIGGGATASLGLFQREGSAGNPLVRGQSGLGSLLDSNFLSPTLVTPFDGLPGGSILPSGLSSEVTGINLEFQLGVSTDRAGELQLGLQFTRILDAEFEAGYSLQSGLHQWALAEPVDSARVSLDWQRNSFSGGIQGYYREPMTFLNGADVNGSALFDVYFSWRTPWNASLSVGASNLLNNSKDDSKAPENNLADPFESIYGRIPYVRYKQDL